MDFHAPLPRNSDAGTLAETSCTGTLHKQTNQQAALTFTSAGGLSAVCVFDFCVRGSELSLCVAYVRYSGDVTVTE